MQEQQKKQINIQEKRKEYLKKLNNQLHHTSKSDVQSAQDISEKYHINPNQNNVINRYFAINLAKLAVNHSEKITYQNQDVITNITAKDCDSNQYALLKSLKSIDFIKIFDSESDTQETTKRIIITPFGQKYIKTYIPRYNRIYNYIKYGKSSMNASNHPFVGTGKLVPKIIGFVLILILIIFCYILNLNNSIIHYHENMNGLYAFYVNLNNLQYRSINALIGIGILIDIILLIKIIIYFYTHRSAIKYHHYRNENVSKDIRKATRKKFVQFLKNNHIKEPDYRFNYDKNLPKISYYLFNNKQH